MLACLVPYIDKKHYVVPARVVQRMTAQKKRGGWLVPTQIRCAREQEFLALMCSASGHVSCKLL
jgi:hypothetical protein